MMISSKKDTDAINFARTDLRKYEGIQGDYAYHQNFEGSQLRLQTMTYKDCYERHIITDELPTQPTFQFWEVSNIRRFKVPAKVAHHEWNQLLLSQGYKPQEGQHVKLEYSFEDFDALIEEEVAMNAKRKLMQQQNRMKREEEEARDLLIEQGLVKLSAEERAEYDQRRLLKLQKQARQ